MLRYLRALSDRDFALDRGMIPLGSCTMKLNPTTSMEAISLPGFANLHPFAPVADAQGYLVMIDRLCAALAAVTGYDRVSVQPNAGSQGEFAGLMAIRSYHLANGDDQRTVCLIPASAHGTNAASAVMAGMKVVVVKTADDGSVDLDDLRAKIDANRDTLAAIMVTYPSTHGVCEDTIRQLCALVHDAGGQVYVDGANLNALLGWPSQVGSVPTSPPQPAQDVRHSARRRWAQRGSMVAVRALGPVPAQSSVAGRGGACHVVRPGERRPVRVAGVLPISYAFIAMLGPDGLRESGERRCWPPTTSPNASVAPFRFCTPAPTDWWRMESASPTCGRSPRPPG